MDWFGAFEHCKSLKMVKTGSSKTSRKASARTGIFSLKMEKKGSSRSSMCVVSVCRKSSNISMCAFESAGVVEQIASR